MIKKILSKCSLPALILTSLFFSKAAIAQNLNFTVDVCGATVTELRLVGPLWNNWDPTSGPAGTDNGDGTWNVTVTDILTDDLDYLVSLNGNYENLIPAMQSGATCAPVTDYFSYANRRYVLGTADTIIAYGRCVPCDYPDFTITTDVCKAATSVKLTGPRWNWDQTFCPVATSLGNNLWQFSFSPALEDSMEYLIVVDGVMENLVPSMLSGGTCAPVTDFNSYANRRWVLADLNVTNTYNTCGTCSTGLNENQMNSVSLYPNPSETSFQIKSDIAFDNLKITDISGKIILEQKFKNNQDIDVSGFQTGLYFVKFTAKDKSEVVRFIKK